MFGRATDSSDQAFKVSPLYDGQKTSTARGCNDVGMRGVSCGEEKGPRADAALFIGYLKKKLTIEDMEYFVLRMMDV